WEESITARDQSSSFAARSFFGSTRWSSSPSRPAACPQPASVPARAAIARHFGGPGATDPCVVSRESGTGRSGLISIPSRA
ncbi:hypothetical protein GTY41_12315, partial [Streptomyces sp. SID685]|nr:hypothetical protein [Streptomyces sp. SID685]